MNAQTSMDIRCSALGLCEAVPHTNHPAATVQNLAIRNQCAVVRFQPHTTPWSAHPVCSHGDLMFIPHLLSKAGESLQSPRHRVGCSTSYSMKTEETMADWSTQRSTVRLTLLVRAARSIGLRCVCEECGRPMYRPISFKLYSSRTLHQMLKVFKRLQRVPHLVP